VSFTLTSYPSLDEHAGFQAISILSQTSTSFGTIREGSMHRLCRKIPGRGGRARATTETVRILHLHVFFQVMDASCLLSTKTGSDVGGLYKQPSVQLHYFEMKPILGK
jgi:hypothetical protein